MAEELDIQIEPFGSTTFKRLGISGAEPDECFYVRNINIIKSKKRLDPEQDPAPDLVIEIDITSSSSDRLAVYKDLGVAEVWIYDGKSLQIKQLQNQAYISSSQSDIFPNLPLLEISQFLEQVGEIDYLELIKTFRKWVRSQIDRQ